METYPIKKRGILYKSQLIKKRKIFKKIVLPYDLIK